MDRNTAPPGTSSSSSRAATCSAAVVVPDPGGPETVINKWRRACSAREGVEQRLALLVAQAPDTPAVGDADLLHRPAGAHLAHARERLEDGEHLHLADHVAGLRLVQEVAQGERSHLELLLQLGPGAACLGGLGQCCFALLRSQLRWLRHGAHPSARSRALRDTRLANVDQPSDATRARAAETGLSARVTGRPTTSRSAPAAMAWRGVATRPWSSMGAPSGRLPGVASRARGARGRSVANAGAATAKPVQPPSRPVVTRWCSRWVEASCSLVSTVTPSGTGSGASAPAAPSRNPSTPARTMAAPPAVWKFR